MQVTHFKDASRPQETATDSLLAIPQVLLTSSEQLIALTAQAALDAINDGATALRALGEVRAPTGLQEIYSDLSAPMLDRALDYGRTLVDILARTQVVVGRLVVDACRMPDVEDLRTPLASPWPAILSGQTQTSPPQSAPGDRSRAVGQRRSAA